MDVGKEQLLAVERNTVRHTDITYITARARGINRLHHGFLRSYAFQHRVGTDALGQILDARNTLIASLSHDVGSTELTGELLARRVTAHCDDPLRTHLSCGKHSQKTDCAITDHQNRRSRLHVGSVRRKP